MKIEKIVYFLIMIDFGYYLPVSAIVGDDHSGLNKQFHRIECYC
jgi:hypothetical protein